MKLTGSKIAALVWKDRGNGSQSAQRHPDGANGLFLQINRNNRKCWVQVFTQHGRRRNIGLGPCRDGSRPGLTLAEARAKAHENRNRVYRGETPAGRRGVTTFETAFRAVVAKRRDTWKHPAETEQDWIGSMDNHMRAIRPMDVARIATADVVGVLEPHWSERRASALKLKARMGQAFKWAVAMQLRPDNPVDAVDSVLPHNQQAPKHHPAIHWSNAPEVLAAVRLGDRMWRNTHLALEFAALTAARSNMVLGAVWDEVDLDARVWTVPADRMKVKRDGPYRCPLSPRAVEVLESVERTSDCVFPSRARKVMDRSQTPRLMQRVMDGLFADGFAERCPNPDEARKAVPHGFRTTFRKWSSEKMGSRWNAAAEAQLAHQEGRVQRSYNRTDYLDERRELMDAWGEYVGG